MVLVLLMGMAAMAIDLSAGWNERRQDQTAADLSVMAGAMEIVQGGTQEEIVNEVLSYARLNLDTTYTDAEWQALWESCQDPERLGYDVGVGVPVDFQSMEAPAAWGGGDLECISQVSSYIRVRIPDQITETTFARVMGFDEITTSASAIAKLEAFSGFGAVLPFGIPGGTGAGEICLRSGPSGQAIPPCQGPISGGFGTINSEFFGDYFPPADCGNPGHPELETNVAIGIDHAVAEWPSADAISEGVSDGSAHPGDNTVRNYQNIGYDQCDIVNGSVVPEIPGHVTPPNTMLVDTGFGSEVQEGLVAFGDGRYHGENSRLQQGGNPTRDIYNRGDALPLDNKGLWDYLTNDNTIPGHVYGLDACDGGKYDGLPIEEKVARMHDCLDAYEDGGFTADIFDDTIDDSPRYVWAPKYWHAASTSGTSWQPVKEFRLVFLAGTYFECNATDCEIIFYPDLETTTDMCHSGGCNRSIALNQVSGFLLPTEAIPDAAIPPYPGAPSDFVPTLFK